MNKIALPLIFLFMAISTTIAVLIWGAWGAAGIIFILFLAAIIFR